MRFVLVYLLVGLVFAFGFLCASMFAVGKGKSPGHHRI
jgi:hypothetical protein